MWLGLEKGTARALRGQQGVDVGQLNPHPEQDAETLDRARTMGLDRVLLTCDPDNTASARTIERGGGQLEDTRDTSLGLKRRSWITR